ncbi:hypothetical protein NQ317_000073 [Molorchus minor]|uniref:Uncharacterized protein n=1 Tax=Molorchus minor TaxID=1323400 RepID=A0ABQ9IYZ9_9CUCU|nr:hypothetical protein NQ317_000073 [Molorchus minor]
MAEIYVKTLFERTRGYCNNELGAVKQKRGKLNKPKRLWVFRRKIIQTESYKVHDLIMCSRCYDIKKFHFPLFMEFMEWNRIVNVPQEMVYNKFVLEITMNLLNVFQDFLSLCDKSYNDLRLLKWEKVKDCPILRIYKKRSDEVCLRLRLDQPSIFIPSDLFLINCEYVSARSVKKDSGTLPCQES